MFMRRSSRRRATPNGRFAEVKTNVCWRGADRDRREARAAILVAARSDRSRIERAGAPAKPGATSSINPRTTRVPPVLEAYHRMNARRWRDARNGKGDPAALQHDDRRDDGALVTPTHVVRPGRGFDGHFEHIREVIGLREGAKVFAAGNGLMMDKHTLLIADTFVTTTPTPSSWPRSRDAVAEVRPPPAPEGRLLSHSMFGSSQPAQHANARARDLFVQRMPDVEADGENARDAALSDRRAPAFPA